MKKELENDEPISLHLGFKINYVQYEDDCALKHKLTIDPNGGIYDGKITNTTKHILIGGSETIKVPKKGDQEFLGWEVTPSSGTYTFDSTQTSEQQFTMGDEDVTLRARWSEDGDFVARIENTYYTTIQSAFDDVDTGWTDNTVHLLKNTTENAVNNARSSFTFDLGGYTVTSASGSESSTILGTITNGTGGNITFINGSIVSNIDDFPAIYNKNNITLGIDDGTVEIENSISIKGTNLAIASSENTNVNYYDGYIEISDNDDDSGIFGVNGNITKPDHYYLTIDELEPGFRAYLINDTTRKVAKVTRPDGVEVLFTTLQRAIEHSAYMKHAKGTTNPDHYRVSAIRSFDAPYEITIPENSDIYFYLEGYEVSLGDKVTNGGKFNILNYNNPNNTSSSKITLSESITNNDTLNITNVNFVSTTDKDIIINNNKLDLKNTTIESKSGYAINNNTNSTISMNDNTVIKSQDNYGIYNLSTNLVLNKGTIYGVINDGDIVIDGAELKSSKNVSNDSYSYAIKSNTGHTITMNSGTVNGTETDYVIYNTGVFNLNGGTISSSNRGINQGNNYTGQQSVIYVNGGTITTTNYSIEKGTVIINDGTIESTNSTTIASSRVEMNGGHVTSTEGVGISSSDSNKEIVINGGEIFGKEAGISSSSSVPIYIKGGTINSDNIGIRSYSNTWGPSINLYISNGTINGKNYGVYASRDFEITGGTINGHNADDENSTSIGVYIYDNCTAVITGGTITGDLYGIQNKSTLTLGENDRETPKNVPKVIGGSYGLYNDKTVKFYDGYLEGIVDGYSGDITEIPLGAVINETTDTINNETYVVKYIGLYENWLRVGNKEFNNINDASEEITTEGTIEVIKDVNLQFPQQFINNEPENEGDDVINKVITFDLNGHTITSNQPITNNVYLTIVDSSENKTGTYIPTLNDGIVNNNKLTINNINVTSSVDKPILNNKNMIVNNATFNVEKNAIYNEYHKDLTVNNINITSNKNGIYNEGSIEFNNGIIHAETTGIYMYYEGSSIVMNNGEIYSNGEGIGGQGGYTEINNGKINTKGKAIKSGYGRIIIEDGEIKSTNDVGVTGAYGITVNGGTITGTNGIENLPFYHVGNLVTYERVEINNGKITGTSSDGMNVQGYNVYVFGGTISGERNGIYSTADIEIGKDDGTITKRTPVIIGKIYGVDSQGYTSFFDGIMKGKTDAHNGLISLIPDGALIKDDSEIIDDETYKTQYLVETENWIRVGDQEFNSINKAARVIETTGTMEIIANPYVDFKQKIPAGKNITIDLKGHSMIMTQPIEVVEGATLKIVDTTATENNHGGGINNINDVTIVNEGSLTIENGIYSSNVSYTVENTGSFTLNNGLLKSNNYNYTVNNIDGANFIMNNGTITGKGGINNIGASTVTINNGTINASVNGSMYTSGDVTINDGNINGQIRIGNNTTTINGGTISSDDITIKLEYGQSGNKPYLTVNDGHIIGHKYAINNVAGYDNGVTINGGLIESEETAIYSPSNGNIMLNGGTIKGTMYGIYNSKNLTLGSDDGTIKNDYPKVIGDSYGIYNNTNATFNFYDGILYGNVSGTTDSYFGIITSIAERTDLFYSTDTLDEKTYDTLSLIPEIEKVKITRLNTTTNEYEDYQSYKNLQDAFDDAIEDDILIVLCDFSLFTPITNNTTAKFTLDLDGHRIITNNTITNKGNLSIINSNSNSATIRTKSKITLIDNNTNAILNIDNINLEFMSSQGRVINNNGELSLHKVNSNASVYSVYNYKKITIDDCTLLRNDSNISVYSSSSERNEITNSTLSGFSGGSTNLLYIENSTINNYVDISRGTANIKDSIVNGRIILSSNCSLTLDNTTVNYEVIYNNNRDAIYCSSNSNLTLIDSTINVATTNKVNNNITAITGYGNVTMQNSNINVGYYDRQYPTSNEYRGIYVDSGTLDIQDSNIYVTGGTNSYGIKTNRSANINLSHSNIKVDKSKTAYGIYSDSTGTITIPTGTIEVIDSSTSYGAYMQKGGIVIGENDGVVYSEFNNYEDPKVYVLGTETGIGLKRVNGTTAFYDGIIYGSTSSIPDTLTSVADEYEVTTYIHVDGVKYSVLENIGDDYSGTAVALLNGIYYRKVQDAINRASNGDEILLLQSTTENFVINKNKDIVINLYGKTLTTSIENNGKLRVYNGTLNNVNNTVVTNTGTFIMGKDDGVVSSTNVRIMSEVTALVNNGTFIIYDGYIEGNEPIDGIINGKAEQSKLYTSVEEQKTTIYIQSMSEESIINGSTNLILYINPNGGTYDGSVNIKQVSLKHNNTYILVDPVKDNAIFDGWEADVDGVLVDDTVTMNLSDVTVTAKWLPNSNAVAQVNDNYYTTLSAAINSANEGDTIKLLKDITEDIVVDKNVIIDLDSHKINGSVVNDSTLQIINGTIENTNGIAITNNGLLILGDNDSNLDNNSPKIIGSTIGIKQNSTLRYYDGTIEGITAVDGSIDSVPNGYYINLENIDGKEKMTLSVTQSDSVAAIDNNGSILYFSNIDSAIESAKTLNKEIFILKDFEGINSITIPENINISINTNGHNIILSNDLINNGTLTIRDKSNNTGSISFTKTIQNNSVLNTENVELKQMTNNDVIRNNGTLNVNGGKIISQDGYAVNNTGNITVINNGEVIGNKYSLYNNSSTPVEINSGKFSGIYNLTDLTLGGDIEIEATGSSVSCVYLEGTSAKVVVNSGTYNSSFRGIQIVNNNQKVTVNGGKFTTVNNVIDVYNSNNTEVTITDGELTSTDTLVIISSSSNSVINISGGKLNGKTKAVENGKSDSTVNISGGELSSYTNNYTININSGTCNISGDAKIISSNYGAIYNYSGTLNITGGYIYSGGLNSNAIYSKTLLNISGNTKIEATGPSSIGIFMDTYNEDNVIDNVEISANIGIQLDSYNSKLTINNGKITGTTYGIYQKGANTKLNIGNSEDTLSINNPYITGGLYGLYKENDGVTNYYNGRLRGSINGYTKEFNNVRNSKSITEEYENGETVKPLVTYSTTNVYDDPISDSVKSGNGYARITYIGDDSCNIDKPYNYLFSGVEAEFTTPCTGKYRLEVWGAQGGSRETGSTNTTYLGGYGGYSSGEINLTQNEKLFINVGGKGTLTSNTSKSIAIGGYNGGGDAVNSETLSTSYSGSGGGATSITTSSGLLSRFKNNREAILIVAGGGSGCYYGEKNIAGASAGGYLGNDGIANNNFYKGGSQTDGYEFGMAKINDTYATPGAGGGYYSGYSGQYAAGGGSGYIGNSRLENAYMYGYNVRTSNPSYINNYLVDSDYYLQVGSDTYNSLQSAVDAITGTGTIKVLSNHKVQEQVTIDSSKDITLDLNGHDLTFTQTMTNNGKFTIIDLTNTNHKIENITGNLINNSGDLSLKNIQIISKGTTIKLYTNNKNILLDNVTINSNGRVIDTNDTPSQTSNTTITINNSTITSDKNTLYISSGNNNILNISDSDISCTNDEHVITISNFNFNFSNSKFSENKWRNAVEIFNSTGSITNCEVENQSGTSIYVSSTQLDINNTILNGKGNCFNVGNDSTVTINNNTKITSNEVGILLSGNNSFVTMNDGIVESDKDGVYVNFNYSTTNTTFNMYGGIIKAKKKGINLNVTDSKVNIGNPNTNLSIESPIVQGEEYALYSSKGIFNLYSGKIKSKDNVSNVNFTTVRKGYKVYETFEMDDPSDLDTKYNVNYLVEKEGFLQVGDRAYSSFEDAISALGEEKIGTITVLDDVLLQEDVTFDGNGIILDLNGYIITTQQTLNNSGKLTIKDSTNTEGMIYNTAGIGINNTGNLTVDSGTIKSRGVAINEQNCDALLTINGGNIISTKDSAIYIYLNTLSSDNSLITTGGNIVGAKYALNGRNLRASINGTSFESSNPTSYEAAIYLYDSKNFYINNYYY